MTKIFHNKDILLLLMEIPPIISKHTHGFTGLMCFYFQAYILPLSTVYIFIFTEVTSAIQGEMHDMRKDPDAEIQNSLCIQQLISALQTLENNSHHMV